MVGVLKENDLGVSKNKGAPKSSILIGFSIINHPFWGTPIFGNTHLETQGWNHQISRCHIFYDIFMSFFETP